MKKVLMSETPSCPEMEKFQFITNVWSHRVIDVQICEVVF